MYVSMCLQVVCMSGASSEGIAVTVAVTTSSASDDSKFYNYTTDATPTVSFLNIQINFIWYYLTFN